jgi:3',5'-cyclic AMP phosphodiesterase CpdA
MPIHLAPLSRRTFLKRSLLAGGAFTFAPQLLAASRKSDPHTWALFSDTHIAADPAKVARETNMTDHFVAAAKEVLSLPQRPAGVLVCGDLAYNSGETGDYRQFTKLLEPLRAGGLPLHLALGNHDHRERFWAALPSADARQRAVADKHVALLKTPRLNWFILDSLEVTLQTPGLLGAAQLEWLARALDANRRKPAAVFVHHNPGTEANINGVKDTQALLDVIRPRRQVKVWIFGHTHVWRHKTDESGLHLVNLPPVAYVFRAGDPAGWVKANVRPDGMKLELRCLDSAHQDHGQVVDLKWRAG